MHIGCEIKVGKDGASTTESNRRGQGGGRPSVLLLVSLKTIGGVPPHKVGSARSVLRVTAE